MSFHKLAGVVLFVGLTALAWAATWPVLHSSARGQEVGGSKADVSQPGADSPAPKASGKRATPTAEPGGVQRNVSFVLHDVVVEGVGEKGDTLSVVLGIKRFPGGNFVAIQPDGTRIPGGNLRPSTHLVDLLLKDVSVKRSSPQPGAGRRTKPSLADLKKGTRVELTILVEDDRLLVTEVTIQE